MSARIIRVAAFALFAASLFAPAVQTADADRGPATLAGWECAFVASGTTPVALVRWPGVDAKGLLVPVSGLINYLFLAVTILSFWPRFMRTRLVLEALMLPCFLATWWFFASSHTRPLVGHFLWVVSCVLIAFPDVSGLARGQELTPESSSADRARDLPAAR